jgi:hypothetical protein
MAKKYLFIVVFGWLVGAGVSAALARDAYLSLAPDIPLAPGLSEFDGGQLVFDKPEGRIVRIEAERVSAQGANGAVPSFYRETLPNLGWQLNSGDNTGDNTGDSSDDNVLTFQRGGETLLISVQRDRVVFKLSPFAESD